MYLASIGYRIALYLGFMIVPDLDFTSGANGSVPLIVKSSHFDIQAKDRLALRFLPICVLRAVLAKRFQWFAFAFLRIGEKLVIGNWCPPPPLTTSISN